MIKQLQTELKTQNKKFISLAPTNKASLIINGITLHKFVMKMKTAKSIAKLQTYDYIFVDEISMVKEIFYKFLLMLKQKNMNIKFIIVGDYNQLAPVNDRVICDYKNSLALYELCDGNRINLTTCRRSDDILYNMCKFENIMNIQKHNFNSKLVPKCISYLHDTRIKVNDMWMKNKLKSYHKKPLRLEKNIYDAHSQDVILIPNTPIISKINNKKIEVVNNETFTIKKILSETIIIFNEEKEIEIDIKDFQNIFYVAYCITIHSSQGETFNEDYTIYDWEKLDKHLRYVALTRATDIKNINIA